MARRNAVLFFCLHRGRLLLAPNILKRFTKDLPCILSRNAVLHPIVARVPPFAGVPGESWNALGGALKSPRISTSGAGPPSLGARLSAGATPGRGRSARGPASPARCGTPAGYPA